MIRRPVSDRPTRLFHGNWRVSAFVGIAASIAIAGSALAGWVGIGAGSGSASVSTLASPTVTATALAGGAHLTWPAVPAPGGSDPVTYFVQRDGSDAGGTCPTSAAPATVTSCTDAGIFAGAYSYTVTAVFHSWFAVSTPVNVGVSSGALTQYHVTVPPGDVTAGTPITVTIAAWDAANRVVTSYSDPNCLTFSGPANSPNGTKPTYPGDAGACSIGDSLITFANGIATASITLVAAGSPTLVVHDPSGRSNGAGVHLTVVGGTAKSFTLSTPGTQTAGVSFNLASISASDAYGNTADAYDGTECVAFSGPLNSPAPVSRAPIYPPGGTSCPGKSAIDFTKGVATGIPITLFNAASTVLTATDSSVSATGSTGAFDVVAAGEASFAIANPGTQTAGVPFTVTITALDGYGSRATSYTGSKCVTFAGPGNSPNGTAPVYPAPGGCTTGRAVTFTNGVASVSITLFRAATTSLTATAGSLTGTSPTFAVVGSPTIAALEMTSSASTLIAGNQANLTVTGKDVYGNTSSYTGTQNLTFTGGVVVDGTPYPPTVSDSSGAARPFGTAEPIAFANGVAAVSDGDHNGAAVLYAAGDNVFHVGDGTHTSGNVTITVTVQASMVHAGSFHTCAVTTYGGVECWGDNEYGQLGHGTETQRETRPVAVTGLRNVVAVNAGQFHTCALLADQTVWCWGRNNNGQLGDGSTTDRDNPVQVTALANVATITTGRLHTCAVLTDGSVWCWGDNAQGQLGINSTADQHSPVRVHGINNVGNLTASAVSAGMYHTCALSSGTVECWGDNQYGELGDGTNSDHRYPVRVTGISNVMIVNAGMYHTCAVIADGHLYCWGRNNRGQLGINSRTDRDAPVLVNSLSNVTAVSGGAFHTCAIAGGTSYCWGRNNSGQVGDGTLDERDVPTLVSGLGSAALISAGGGSGTYEHSAALVSGVVWTWGDNFYGQIGNGTTIDRPVPDTMTLV